uniref:Uncharacterized protein n=1 Tax=viral metagenome TaxID=1070528 RepID=A0A6C0HKJ5_9ZZZZ
MTTPAADSNELQKAHEYYLAAAANRDKDPDTYQGARIRYMALKNGPGWLQQEKQRVNDNKLQPTIDKYRQEFKTLDSQASAQRGLVDSIAGVRDKQADLVGKTSDRFQYLDTLLKEKEAKMSAYDRFVELTTPSAYIAQANTGQGPESAPFVTYFASFPSSFGIILDVVIAVLGLFLLLTILGKTHNMFAGWSNFQRNLYTRASMVINTTPSAAAPAATR